MKRLKHIVKNNRKQLLVVGVIALFGASFLVATQAATFSNEAEDGSRSGNVSLINDPNASGGAGIQFGNGNSTAECDEGPQITSFNICINPASFQEAHRYTDQDLAISVAQAGEGRLPVCHNGEVSGCRDNAALRTNCHHTHTSRNDPIVVPGIKNGTHWHEFFGNTAADENFTDARAQGQSGCQGGTLNKTAYWAPTLIDVNSYDPATRQYNRVPVMTQTAPNEPTDYTRDAAQQIYYKLGYNGARSSDIEWFPEGLRMIAGGMHHVEPTGPARNPVSGNLVIWFDCVASANTQNIVNGISRRETLPEDCPPGAYIQGNIEFPQCGANNPDGSPMLDSPNHRSHMSYASGWPANGCPASHPRTYPQITEHIRYQVPPTGAQGLRFSSDIYPNAPAGLTYHADWWNGWKAELGQQLIEQCYTGGVAGLGWDCQNGVISENQHLDWAVPYNQSPLPI